MLPNCTPSGQWLDHVQETHPRRRSGRHLIIKIALASNAMPRQLYLAGVVFHPMPSVFGGAFSDIYFGTYQAMEVAVKRPRHASSKDRERTAKVQHPGSVLRHAFDDIAVLQASNSGLAWPQPSECASVPRPVQQPTCPERPIPCFTSYGIQPFGLHGSSL
jgi:hypothetical protein